MGSAELDNGDINLIVTGLGMLLKEAEDSVKLWSIDDTRRYLCDPMDVRATRERISGRRDPVLHGEA